MKYTAPSDFKDFEENVYWIALQDKQYLIPTINVVNFYIKNGSLMKLYNLTQNDLLNLGLEGKKIKNFLKYRNNLNFNEISNEFKKIINENIKLIKYVDEKYPSLLRKIDNPPLLLFKKGYFHISNNCIAIAGTRNPSSYGRIMSRKIAYDLAKKGFVIVSGLAHGIDEWAHIGALEAKGKTVAVLAWMKPEYPPEHYQLLQDIIAKGTAISEIYVKPDSRSAKGKFIQRNRITSGISTCVIAIESDDVGGTVHQVKIALEQDKLVFALKPKSNKRALRGFKLFKELGAIPISSSKDIVNTLKTKMAQSIIDFKKSKQIKLDKMAG